MKQCRFHRCAVAVLLLLPAAAGSHHSRSPFLLDETIEVVGVVTEVRWRSPHVYLELDSRAADGAEQHWSFEGHSISGLRNLGWEKESIRPGDRVIVVANPGRDRASRFGLLDSVTRSDGRTFYSFRIPDGETVAGRPSNAPMTPSTDFSGYWWRKSTLREALTGSFKPPDWAVTARGQAQLDRFDLDEDPQLDCVPVGVPAFVFYPYSAHWVREDDRIVIDKDQHPQDRIIHLDDSAPPADYVPDAFGWSLGHFEDDGTLVVRTTQFAPTPWGAARGLDSSDRKQVTERYRLTENGYGMDVSYTIEDPVYLAEPVTVTGEYRLVAAHDFNEIPCDVDTARRHLAFE